MGTPTPIQPNQLS
ncbi:conserved hypothetical protein, partial [Trichinella spiralis]